MKVNNKGKRLTLLTVGMHKMQSFKRFQQKMHYVTKQGAS